MSKKWILCVNFYYIYIPYAWLFEDHPIYRVLLKGVIDQYCYGKKGEKNLLLCVNKKKNSLHFSTPTLY